MEKAFFFKSFLIYLGFVQIRSASRNILFYKKHGDIVYILKGYLNKM